MLCGDGAVPDGRHVRLGTMLTPLPWRRPWKVASQVATLDQLSGGRAILAVGVGATGHRAARYRRGHWPARPGRADGRGHRPDQDALGRRHSYHGRHYDYQTGRMDLTGAVRPVQHRIPIWVVGVWPAPRSMRRRASLRRRHPAVRPAEHGRLRRAARSARGLRARRAGRLRRHRGRRDPRRRCSRRRGDDGLGAGRLSWWLETRWAARDELRERIARPARVVCHPGDAMTRAVDRYHGVSVRSHKGARR